MVEDMIERITALRITQPDLPLRLAHARQRRTQIAPDGRLVIVAADHPARHIVSVGDNPLALADRGELLRRLMSTLSVPGIDGVLGTPDILEDLLVFNWLRVERGEPDALADKVLLGSMNRGGLAGSVFEQRDPVTAYDAAGIAAMRLEGGKLLVRLDLQAPDTSATLVWVAEALRALARHDMPAFIEVLPARPDAETLAAAVGVVTALGSTSRRMWLKLPVYEPFVTVARSTTCPILLLGGGDQRSGTAFREQIQRALDSGANVRGLIVGRAMLFPPDGADLRETAATLAALIHGQT